jgi:hypothetical protein
MVRKSLSRCQCGPYCSFKILHFGIFPVHANSDFLELEFIHCFVIDGELEAKKKPSRLRRTAASRRQLFAMRCIPAISVAMCLGLQTWKNGTSISLCVFAKRSRQRNMAFRLGQLAEKSRLFIDVQSWPCFTFASRGRCLRSC